jgi:hypothetical protein
MKRIRANHEWYELRGARVRVSREVRDCDMQDCQDWRGAIQPGDTYAWMSHGLNVCSAHFADGDVQDV